MHCRDMNPTTTSGSTFPTALKNGHEAERWVAFYLTRYQEGRNRLLVHREVARFDARGRLLLEVEYRDGPSGVIYPVSTADLVEFELPNDGRLVVPTESLRALIQRLRVRPLFHDTEENARYLPVAASELLFLTGPDAVPDVQVDEALVLAPPTGVRKQYDFRIGTVTYEVKRDNVAFRTGQLTLEHRYRRNPSGIVTTRADFFVYVLGQVIAMVPTVWLRELWAQLGAVRDEFSVGDARLVDGMFLRPTEVLCFPVRIELQVPLHCDPATFRAALRDSWERGDGPSEVWERSPEGAGWRAVGVRRAAYPDTLAAFREHGIHAEARHDWALPNRNLRFGAAHLSLP
jgi:hypothetical protein